MSASAGRVLIKPRGVYNSGTAYEMLDSVFFNGSSYICLKDSLGHAPTDSEYWQIFAQGAGAISGAFAGACDSLGSAQIKSVIIPPADNFALQKGVIVGVRFTNTNTFEATSENSIALNVNSTGALPIYFGGTVTPLGSNIVAFGEAAYTHFYQYDGTNWVFVGRSGVQTAEQTPLEAPISIGGASKTNAEDALSALNISKADKVSGATNGNFAALDLHGNLTDSGKKASDFQTALTFDNVPTQNSSNPVKSGGVYNSVKTVDDKFNALNTRARTNITTKLSNLSTAISEQNLAKYGYSIGDYFTGPSGYTYFLAQLNPFKGTTTPYNLATNHIGLVVNTHTTSKWLAGGDASAVGYAGSDLHAYLTGTVLNNIKSDMLSLFGGSTGLEHLLKHSKLMTTALENWAWTTDQYISALTESQVYGHREWSGNNYQEGEAVNQLDIFRKFKWTEIFGSEYPWLRNLFSAPRACCANLGGYADYAALTGAYYAAGLINFY